MQKITETMKEDQIVLENLKLGRQVFAAFARGDLEAFATQWWAPDVVMRFTGKNPFSGTHRGREAAIAAVRKSFEITRGTLNVENIEVLAGDRSVVFNNRVRATRDGRTLDTRESVTVRIENGKTVEWTLVPHDQYAWDAFFS